MSKLVRDFFDVFGDLEGITDPRDVEEIEYGVEAGETCNRLACQGVMEEEHRNVGHESWRMRTFCPECGHCDGWFP